MAALGGGRAFNLADLFELVAAAVPERVALVHGARRLTYAALDERATRCANALRGAGLRSGAHVGLALFDTVEHVEAMLGCYKARLVPINVNYRYTSAELGYLIDNADLAALLHEAEHEAAAAAACDTAAAALLRIRCGPRGGGATGYAELVAAATSANEDEGRSGDDHYILYTGGTTGMPKGVVWRQEDIFFAVMGGGNAGGPPIAHPEEIGETVRRNRAQRIGPFLGAADSGPAHYVGLGLGPLIHASGQWSTLGTLLGGGTAVLYDRPHMDMEHVLDLLERERVCALNLVGDANARPLLEALLRNPGRWDTSSLLLLGSGGAMLSADVKEGLLAALPSVLAVLEGLGSSECPAQAIAVARRGVATASLTFQARPETMLVDEDLQPIAPGSGRVGRLATRGRVPLGYYNDAERSAATFVQIDGQRWTLPGDMATLDADGTVRLIGRGSQCINSGGEKVYPAEVEAVLVAHPAVNDAVVVGVADATWGERVTAVVAVGSAHAPTLAALQEHCRSRLAGYKIPRALVIVDSVRRSPAGKADYPWARDLAAAAR